jgi:hypothetical protein
VSAYRCVRFKIVKNITSLKWSVYSRTDGGNFFLERELIIIKLHVNEFKQLKSREYFETFSNELDS